VIPTPNLSCPIDTIRGTGAREFSGLGIIRALKHDPALADVPVMLVSNHADAQEAALDLGASPGFGKASLHSDATLARIKALLGR